MGFLKTVKSALFLGVFCVLGGNISAFAGWGAIAYNYATGASGEAHGYSCYDDAANVALSVCGAGCTVINWENNLCIALAAGNGSWGEGHGYSSAQDAVNAAINACGPGCAWLEWACN